MSLMFCSSVQVRQSQHKQRQDPDTKRAKNEFSHHSFYYLELCFSYCVCQMSSGRYVLYKQKIWIYSPIRAFNCQTQTFIDVFIEWEGKKILAECILILETYMKGWVCGIAGQKLKTIFTIMYYSWKGWSFHRAGRVDWHVSRMD